MKTPSSNPTWTVCPDPSLQINSVAVSSDGSRCVFGTSNEFGGGTFSTFFYDQNGTELWSKPVSKGTDYQGVFWTAVSANGKFVTSGGEVSKTQGFLLAYNEPGFCLLDAAPASRINQVSLSDDGQRLAVCYGSTVEVYQLNDAGTKYEILGSKDLSPFTINSCEISGTGNTLVASGIRYIDSSANTTTTEGRIYAFKVTSNGLETLGTCDPGTGSMRVAISSNGKFWAASLHDGSCMLVHAEHPSYYQWRSVPEKVSLSLAYAVDVTETKDGVVWVACGANVHDTNHAGLLYMVKSQWKGDRHVPEIKWQQPLLRSANPGVSIDTDATWVTATDGQPISGSTQETPGSFYLFNVRTGEKAWSYDTSLMNWPMQVSADGKHAFGGSDNGSVYYWDL
jgi:hypothetical protein